MFATIVTENNLNNDEICFSFSFGFFFKFFNLNDLIRL